MGSSSLSHSSPFDNNNNNNPNNNPAMDYNGLSFGEKKKLKEGEVHHAKAEKQIQDKLGAGWKLNIDWPAIVAVVPAGHGQRDNLSYAIYSLYCVNLGDEVAAYEPDLVEAINGKITSKKITIGIDKSGDSLDRYRVNVSNEVVIAIEPQKLGYEYPYSRTHTVKTALEAAL